METPGYIWLDHDDEMILMPLKQTYDVGELMLKVRKSIDEEDIWTGVFFRYQGFNPNGNSFKRVRVEEYTNKQEVLVNGYGRLMSGEV